MTQRLQNRLGVHPEFFYSGQLGNKPTCRGMATVRQVGGVGCGLNGVADFRATIANDPNGVEIFINLDGFYGKIL